MSVTYELNGKIATIAMDDGKANALSHAMFDQLNEAFDKAEKDAAIVLLKGREKRFSGGYDLAELAKGPNEAKALVKRGSELARRIMSFQTPVIGVSTGHCIAMGAFLMLSCDYRIGTAGAFKIGLNETAIGMPMHSFGIEIARYRLPRNIYNRSVINGEIFNPETAITAGFYDIIVEADQLHETADAVAQQFSALSMKAFSYTKVASRKDVLALLDQCIIDDTKMEINLGD